VSSFCVLEFGSPCCVTSYGYQTPGTNREMSIAVESRDANLVVWEDLIGGSYDVSFRVP